MAWTRMADGGAQPHASVMNVFDTYRCIECSYEYTTWRRLCVRCGRRGLVRPCVTPSQVVVVQPEDPDGRSIKNTPRQKVKHIATGIDGADRVFGTKGIVFPSTILFGGAQGCGKSSMALQIAAGVGGDRVLYFAAEQPAEDVASRVDQLGLTEKLEDMVTVCKDRDGADNMEVIRERLARTKRDFIVIDSLSTLVDPDNDTKEDLKNRVTYAKWFYTYSKTQKKVVLLVSWLNKESDFAGMRAIQYIVDTVCKIEIVEGSKSQVRVLHCPEKNRFASTAAKAFFLMLDTGLVEVPGMQEIVED